jgi:hypothetical protein
MMIQAIQYWARFLRPGRPVDSAKVVARRWPGVGLWMSLALLLVTGSGGVAALAALPAQESAAAGAPVAAQKSPSAAQSPSATQSPPAAPQPVLPLTADQIAAHLGETVDWYHHLEPIKQLPVAADDTASRGRLQQQSLTDVRLAFDFGKACAALLDAQSKQPGATDNSAPATGLAARLDQAAAELEQRVNELQSQLAALDAKIPRARGQERSTLTAQRGQVAAALDLARQVQASVADMEKFEANTIEGDNSNLSALAGQIADMERSVPEARKDSTSRGAGPR